MTRKCCYYERGEEKQWICTTDTECPELEGWTFVGSWGVGDCEECFGSEPPPPPRRYYEAVKVLPSVEKDDEIDWDLVKKHEHQLEDIIRVIRYICEKHPELCPEEPKLKGV